MPQPSVRRPSIVLQIFLSILILAGVVVVGRGVWNLFCGLRCESWPTADGVIDQAEMNSQTNPKSGVTYSADLSYHYQVAGISYSGTRLGFGMMFSTATYAQRILDRYPIGARVRVHYLPGDPEQAVLETGIHGGIWFSFGVGAAIILLGYLTLQSFRKTAAEHGSLP